MWVIIIVFHYTQKLVKQLIVKERETILNKAKDYYENKKEVLREKARNSYRQLSEEKKRKDRNWKK